MSIPWIFAQTAAASSTSDAKPTATALSLSPAAADPELLTLVSQYLKLNGFSEANQKLIEESARKKIKLLNQTKGAGGQGKTLVDVYERFKDSAAAVENTLSPTTQLVREAAADDTSDTLSLQEEKTS